MRWPDFYLARHFGRTSKDRLSLYGLGICAALLLPLLVLDLGLVMHLVLGSPDSVLPSDWILGPWTSGKIVAWPLFGDERLCLLSLLAAGISIGLLEVWALWLLNRAVHRAALDVVVRFLAEIHRQAYNLGTSDLLGGRRSPPEQLVGEMTGVLREGLLRWWSAVPYAVVAVGSLVFVALAVNIWLALVVILAGLLVRQVYGVVGSHAADRVAAVQVEADKAEEQLLRNLRGTPLATGYALSDAPGRPFSEILQAYRQAALRVDYQRASDGPALLLMIVLAVAYVLLVIGLSRYVTVAGTFVLTTALIGAYFPVARLYRLRGSLADADCAANALFAYLRREPGVQQVSSAVPIDRLGQSIRLEQVTLANADGVKLLDHVDLTIDAGQHVAVLATDLSASMALAGLFVRLYDPAAGRVLFDGCDIATATLDTVRGQSLLVPADGMLYEGTVHDNISCGDAGFTMLQVTDAAKQARAQNFVMGLPRGFSTLLGGNGAALNNSEAFRVGLARALLRNPSILVIAEPANEVDESTAASLNEALRLAGAGRTLILLPTRLTTLRAMDKVVVLHEGKLHAEGTHTQLLKSSPLYRHLNYVRFHTFRGIR